MATDVYCYGMVSPSTVHILREDFAYPERNTYAEVERSLPSIGGEAANSAIVLARLGLRVRLDGNWLNERRAAEVKATLASYGIDVSRLRSVGTGGTEEFVIADGSTRTVFGNYAAFHAGPPQWNEPQDADIAGARIACLDPYFRDASRNAAELCAALGIPYVTQDSPFDEFVARQAAAVVVSHELRDASYAGSDAHDLFRRFREACSGLVIFTFGADELWFGRHDGDPSRLEPYRVEAVDTTGAGDSFRGAIAYGLLQGWPDEHVVDFASAVAARVCMSYPHALNAPTLPEVRAFVERSRAGAHGGEGGGGE